VSGAPRVEAGESGVAGLAALIAAASQPALARTLGLNRASRVLVIGSEGVTDPAILAELLRNGDGQADASA
jgi:diaminopropionate ammonia-lyase